MRAALRDSEALAAEGGSSWAGAMRELKMTLELTGVESPVELEERLRREYAARLPVANGTRIAFYRDAVCGWSSGVDFKDWSAPEYLRAALPAGRRDALARLRCASLSAGRDGAVDACRASGARRRRGVCNRRYRRRRPRAQPRRRRVSPPRPRRRRGVTPRACASSARSECAASAPAARSRTRRT